MTEWECGGPPRLGARPLERPEVHPASASTFGRPAGVEGGFAAQRDRRTNGHRPALAPPPAALAGAFGRPPGSTRTLQRPPDTADEPTEAPNPLWDDGEANPWRDPD